jgi:hypothetical protein
MPSRPSQYNALDPRIPNPAPPVGFLYKVSAPNTRRHKDCHARVTRVSRAREMARGKRADLIRVRETDGVPVVLRAWREGERVV